MSNVIVRKVGNGFEVSNGTYTVQGPNRADLLKAMDALEGQPASVEKIQQKVETAAAVAKAKKDPKTTKKVKRIPHTDQIRDLLKASKGTKMTAKEVAVGTGLPEKRCGNVLYYLWQRNEIKSHEEGLYFA